MKKTSRKKEKNVNGSKPIFKISILLILIFLTISLSGCLGEHKECPECGGTGRDPSLLFLTECPVCGGDGEVGMFIEDEGLEDILSYLILFIIVISIIGAIIGGIANAMKSEKKENTVQPVFIRPPSSPLSSYREIDATPSPRFPEELRPSMSDEISSPPSEGVIIPMCPYCGEELNYPDPIRFCPFCRKQLVRT